MVKTELLVLVSLFALATVQARSQGTFVYDQQSSTGPVLEGLNLGLNSGQPLGQSFTPSLSTVGFVSLNMVSGPTTIGNYVDVLLHSGSITGPTIGTSEAVLIPINFSGFANFIFDTPPTVTPGTQYYFQPVIESGPGGVAVSTSTSYNYPGGNAFFQGTSYPADDLWFREGIIVPEPSTWALLVLGSGAFIWLRRR
jgi:hypothetical protein